MKNRSALQQSTARPPLVTFALFAYNQERFIEEAVRAALAQTYEPLEVILSDDCSQDATFEIIQCVAEEYSGPHKVVVNQNQKNLGMGGHVNRIFELAEGELVIAAAGDDISFPERSEVLVTAWEEAGRPATVCSAAEVIGPTGESLAPRYTGYDGRYPATGEPTEESLIRYASEGSRHLLGCSAAWSRQIFGFFGPLSKNIVNEDNVFAFRSWLLDGILYVDQILVGYRQHDTNLYNSNRLSRLTSANEFAQGEAVREKRAKWEVAFLRQHVDDLQTARAKDMRQQVVLDQVERNLRRRLMAAETVAGWSRSNILARIQSLGKLLALGDLTSFRAQSFRIVPNIYCYSRSTIRHLKDWISPKNV